MLACLGLSTSAQQPTAAFKRLGHRTEAQLQTQLLQVRELDLATDGKEPAATLVGEIRAMESFRRAGAPQRRSADASTSQPTPAETAPPESLARLHQEAHEALGLPGRSAGDCRLEKGEALKLATWATRLRDLKLVSIPGRDGQFTPPKVTALTADELEIKARLKLAGAIPALVQMLSGEAEPSRQQLINLLKQIDKPAAAEALARLAVFDVSPQLREQAIDALQPRPATQYRQVLLDAFRYPWPTAAENAAEALVALRDVDAVSKLQALLDQPDPAAPVVTPGTGKPPQVRELVRVNHLRNCVLCHAVSTGDGDLVRGAVPTPGQPIPLVYYQDRGRSSLTFVRADITYLRQDFSLVMPVEKAAPWPDRQRFDFLVRTRDATPQELEETRKAPPEKTYPQREAVRFALKELSK
jgi:hypothetical protein